MTIASYLICATPRSGSTLLCDLLKQTGVAGRPNSFYRRESLDNWVRRFGIEPGTGVEFERRYLDATIKDGTGDTGMFGMRVMWPSMPELLGQLARLFPEKAGDSGRIEAAFGTPVYIHLQRKDRVAQAISRSKAEQSGLWHRGADGSERELVKPYEAPRYDAAQLERFIAEAEAHEAAWAGWFAAAGITPLEVSYEALSADPAATLERVLGALGCDPEIAARAAVKTARLADAESRAWAERYAKEQAGF
jgi:LPS sulfotransferase NodH